MGFFSSAVNWVRGIFGHSNTDDQGKKNDEKPVPSMNPMVPIIRRLRLFFCRARNMISSSFLRALNWCCENPWHATSLLLGITMLILLACTPAILGAVGLSAIGPVAGTTAASYQSAFGATAAFSIFQSAAMGGWAMGAIATVLGSGGGALIVLGGFGDNIKSWVKGWTA